MVSALDSLVYYNGVEGLLHELWGFVYISCMEFTTFIKGGREYLCSINHNLNLASYVTTNKKYLDLSG